jgi:hypothetical protein
MKDMWLDRRLDFVLAEIERLDDDEIAWFFWKEALIHCVYARRVKAWEAITAASSWLVQLERRGE